MRIQLTIFRTMMILIPFLITSASAAERVVSILPDACVVTNGMQFSVEIAVNGDVDSLMGWDVAVGFDPSLLEVVDAAEGPLPSLSGRPTFFRWLNEGCACDSVHVNGSILCGTVDGPGALFTITFRAIALGTASISCRRCDLRNGLNEKLPHSCRGAVVVIEPPISAELSSWSGVKTLYK